MAQMAQAQGGRGPHSLEFREWVRGQFEKNTCMMPGGSDAEPLQNQAFVSPSELEAYMEQALPNLLNEVFGLRFPPVGKRDIMPSHLKAFATLVHIGQGELIEWFVKKPRFGDIHLPLESKPIQWPGLDTDSSWEDFDSFQWRFFPAEVHRGSKELEDRRVVPFTKMLYLDGGESSTIHRIDLHRDFDYLGVDRCRPQKNMSYVLKTYKGQAAKIYHSIETTNFLRLRNSNGTSRDGIIECYASFTLNGTYYAILEYAEGGSLEDWMKKRPEPKDVLATADHWKGFIECLKGLEVIHERAEDDVEPTNSARIFQGLHQDICSSNILLRRSLNPGSSRFEFLMVLSDLGLSHFDMVEKAEQQKMRKVIPLRAGETYEAPELYQRTESDQKIEHRITRGVDVWAMGCVMLDYATWLVQGIDEVESFRQRRIAETRAKSTAPGDRFHDGRLPTPATLESVERQVVKLRANMRNDDTTTGPMLDIVEKMLDPDPAARTSIHHVRQAAETILDSAKSSDDGFTPPRPAPSIVHRAGTERPQGTRVGALSSPDLQNASDPLERPIQETRSKTTGPICDPVTESQDGRKSTGLNENNDDRERIGFTERSGSVKRPAFTVGTTDDINPTTRFEPRASPSDGHHIRSRPSTSSPPSSSHMTDDLTTTSPESYHGPSWDRHDNRQDDPRHIESPVDTRAGPSTDLSAKRSTSSGGNRSVPADEVSGVPYISFEDAEKWARNAESQRKQARIMKSFKRLPAISSADSLQKLEGRRHIILIDDGQTMVEHHRNVIKLFQIMVHIISYYGTYHGKSPKVEVYFTNSNQSFDGKSPEDLVRQLRNHDFKGRTDMRESLAKMFNQQIISPPGKMSSIWRSREKKSLYVLTDGVWEGGSDVRSRLEHVCSTLGASGRGREDFNIQFVRFGDDERLEQRLQELDDLAIKDPKTFNLDIVDTAHWRGDVLKILLGATMNLLDSQPGQQSPVP